MRAMKLPTLVRDALYNLHMNSGATDDYRRAILVGVISTLVGVGCTFEDAINASRAYGLKHGIPVDNFAPESWKTCPPA